MEFKKKKKGTSTTINENKCPPARELQAILFYDEVSCSLIRNRALVPVMSIKAGLESKRVF